MTLEKNQEQNQIKFSLIDNPSIKGREDQYMTIRVDLQAVIESWKISLFSFEWLTPDGGIRTADQLPEKERKKFEDVCVSINKGDALIRPILGIGVMDNVEIGSRRDVLLTLITRGVKNIDAHIPKSLAQEFAPYQ